MAAKYWVGGSGSWSQTSHWSLTSGGASGAAVPTASDDVIIDGNSGTGSYTISVNGTPAAFPLSITINNTTNSNSDCIISIASLQYLAVQASATLTRFTQSSTLGTCTITGAGSLVLNCGVAINNPSLISFTVTTIRNDITYGGAAISQWNFNNCSMSSGIVIFSSGMTLTGNLTTTGGFSHTNNGAGPVTITGYTLSVGSATIGGTSIAATYNFGSTGVFNITGTTGTVLTVNNAYTPTGSNAYLNITGGGSTARSIAMGNGAGASVNVTNGTYALTQNTAGGLFDSLNFTGFSGTWVGDATACSIAGTLTLSPTMTMGVGTGAVSFIPPTATTKTHQLNGLTFNRPMTINGPDATAVTTFNTSTGATSVTGLLTISGGKLDITDTTFTAQALTISGATAKVVAFGTSGNFLITAPNAGQAIFTNSGATNFSHTGTSNVTVNTTDTGTKAFNSTASTATTMYDFFFTGGTYTLSVTTASLFNNVDFTGSSVTLSGGTNAMSITGNLTLSSTTVVSASTGAITFASTSGTKTITTNGRTIDRPVTFNGAGGTWQLQDSLTMGSTRLLSQTNGTLDLNAKTLTTGTYATVAGTKNLTFNGGALTVVGSGATAFNNAVPAGFTTTAGTAKGYIYMTSASAKTFVGGGSTYNATLVQAGAGALTLSGSNTLSNIKNTTQPAPITFTSSTTTTFTDDFKLKGTNGALIVITASTAGTAATVSKTSGTISCDYISVKDNLPAGGATWYAGAHSTRVSNYTGVNGWFTTPVSANTEFLMLFP